MMAAEKATLERLVREIKGLRAKGCSDGCWAIDDKEADAIDALLEADLISRESVLEVLRRYHGEMMSLQEREIIAEIEKLEAI